MSTRATYMIQTELTDVYFYIHYDGYPKGAAQYIKKAIAIDHKKIPCSAKRFLLANLDVAEFTYSHETHGDTEYMYNIIDNMIYVYEANKALPLFQGTINAFLREFTD